VTAGRAAGAAFLDEAFACESPLPELPAAWRHQIEFRDILLPPLGRLARGNQDHAGLTFLVSIAHWLNSRDVFEIGTYNGLTARCFAANLPQAEIHTLDIPGGMAPALTLDPGDRLHIGVALSDLSLREKRIHFLHCDSAVFDFAPFERSCDLVYVDGAHSLEYVLSDSERALRMLRDPAAIVWDDYRRGMDGVVRGLDLLSTRHELHRVPGTRLAVYLTPAARANLETPDG
jgi:hypothetical protein